MQNVRLCVSLRVFCTIRLAFFPLQNYVLLSYAFVLAKQRVKFISTSWKA